MSISPEELFFSTVPSCYFHCSGALYRYRDNLHIEVACDERSLMIRGPKLRLHGLYARISNRTKETRGQILAYIALSQPIEFELDEYEINRDYLHVCASLCCEHCYADNQVCSTVALLEVFKHNELALRFEVKSGDLVLLTDIKGESYPRISLRPLEHMWLRSQKPSRSLREEEQKRLRGIR